MAVGGIEPQGIPEVPSARVHGHGFDLFAERSRI